MFENLEYEAQLCTNYDGADHSWCMGEISVVEKILVKCALGTWKFTSALQFKCIFLAKVIKNNQILKNNSISC